MTAYELLVAGHVAGAICWVGSDTYLQISSHRIVARENADEIGGFVSDLVFLGPRWLIPVSLLTVVFGVGAVLDGPWSFGDPWVSAGLTMFVISFLIGLLYLTPGLDKLDGIGKAEGTGSAAFATQLGKILLASRIEMVLLWATVLVMVLKPG